MAIELWNQIEHWIRQAIAAADATLITIAAIFVLLLLFLLRRLQARLGGLWDHLSASFWFIPGLMMISAVALSVVMVELDTVTQAKAANKISWLWHGGPEAARVLLGTIALSGSAKTDSIALSLR